MPPADYATAPGTADVVYTATELDAELALKPITDKLTSFSSPSMPVRVLLTLAGYVYVGTWLRGHHVPHGWDVAGGISLLLILAVVTPTLMQIGGKKEPGWAVAALHEQTLLGRLPAPTYRRIKAVMDRMTHGTRWRQAYLYVARCTRKDPEEVHYDACCAGGTYPRQGRLLVIVGEHLAYGLPEAAVATLAHERRHVTPRRVFFYAVASLGGTFGLTLAGWAVPRPALFPVVAGVRIASVLLLWAVEVSCDIGGALDTGASAMMESVNYKQRTKEGARALWPTGQRWTVNILTWVTGPEHPPYALRRLLIRKLTR